MIKYLGMLILPLGISLSACDDTVQPTTSAEPAAPLAKKRTATGITITDLGLGRAEDIDDGGRIVGGRGSSSGPLHAFLWTPTTSRGTVGSFTDLGDLGGGASQARAINAHSQIAGSSTD